MRHLLLLLGLLACTSGFSKEKDSTRIKNSTDNGFLPSGELQVDVMDPLNAILDQGRALQLNASLNFHRKNRLYICHSLSFRHYYSASFWESSESFYLYDFNWMLRFRAAKNSRVHFELGFGPSGGLSRDVPNITDTFGIYSSPFVPTIGATVRGRFLFDIGSWGSISLSANFRAWINSLLRFSGHTEYFRLGMSFYLGRNGRMN